MASTLPWHQIPASTATCKVHLIQAGGLSIPTDMVLLPGPDEPNDSTKSGNENEDSKPKSFYAPDYVFLIEHPASGTTYIFDLGMRKDLENLPPTLVKNVLPKFKCEPQSPADILKQHGTASQQPENIKAVIFSHMHFDHVGDGAQAGFHHAELWIGPTCCTYARPGYPVDPDAPTLSETLPVDGSRKIVESFIPDAMLKDANDKRLGQVDDAMSKGKYNAVDLKKPDWIGLGAFDRAYDVFGDGAAYLIDAPGHSAGHQMMLVRTTTGSGSGEDTFVLLAGDCFHHVDLLREPRRTARPPYAKTSMHSDPEQAVDTIFRTREFARRSNVWVIAAHDATVGESIGPGKREIEGLVEVNGWFEMGWKNVRGAG
jgi:glyoxylase-like metal-dependent hydrolase (beta-lactamase superfamily II)